VDEISKETGREVNFTAGDLSIPDDVKRVMEEVKKKT